MQLLLLSSSRADNSEYLAPGLAQITAILGECFGGSAWTASVSDIVLQVKRVTDLIAEISAAASEQSTNTSMKSMPAASCRARR